MRVRGSRHVKHFRNHAFGEAFPVLVSHLDSVIREHASQAPVRIFDSFWRRFLRLDAPLQAPYLNCQRGDQRSHPVAGFTYHG